MSLYQRDYILRLIEAVGATLRRALRRKDEGDVDGARAEVAATMAEVLGPGAPMVPLVDSQTAANLVSDPQRIALYGQLLEVDAELLDAKGQPERALATRRRATELLLELVLRRAELPDETIVLAHRLMARGDRSGLTPRYREAWDMAARLVTRPGGAGAPPGGEGA